MNEEIKVHIELTQKEALVLSEFIERLMDRENYSFEDQAEQRVLWDIECMIEKGLTDPCPGITIYDECLKMARDAVRDKA